MTLSKRVKIIPEKVHNLNTKINAKLWNLVLRKALDDEKLKTTGDITEAAFRCWLDS